MEMKYLLVIAIVSVAACFWLQSSSAQKLSPDGQVIEQLKKAGSNLSKPHDAEFFLYFPTKEAADRVAENLKSSGFGTTVRAVAKGPEWLLLATKAIIPTEAEMVRLRTELSALSEKEQGSYDGWGTPVVS